MGHCQIFVNLRFLVLVEFSWPEKFSLKSLDNLKTLWFVRCDLLDFGKGEVRFLPEKLENLCFWDCEISKQLNLPELNHLRKLEIYVTYWWYQKKIVVEPNIISRLSSLEELSLPIEFYISQKCEGGGSLSVLDEVSELSCLTSLHIWSEESKSSDLATIFSNLREFHLFVYEKQIKRSMKVSSVTKSIKLCTYDVIDYQTLIEKAEEVVLCDTNFTGSSIVIRETQEFVNLKYMEIKDCKDIEYLARMSSRHKIPESLHPSIPFSNLIKLKIENCRHLKYLFCSSVARCLNQLQQLKIEKCPIMEEVVLEEGKHDENIIIMSKLQILILSNLPRLVHFYKDNMFSGQIQPLFNQMVEFPSLETLHIGGMEDITDIWGDNHDNASSFSKLKTLTVRDCNNLKTVLPPAMLSSSLTSEVDTLGSSTDSATCRASQGNVKAIMVSHNPNKKLQIFLRKIMRVSRSVCRRTPAIREKNLNDPSDISVQVPSQNTRVCPLAEMYLAGLPCLEKTGFNFEDQSRALNLYPNLQRLHISECHTLEKVFIPSPEGHFMNIEDMSVTKCMKMCEIIGTGKQKITNDIVFQKLFSLELRDLPGLTSFWGCPSGEANNHKVGFPNLKKLHLRCGENTNLVEMIESGRDDSSFQLEDLYISCNEEMQIPNQWLPHLYNLESLSLERCWSDELKSLRFQRLKEVTLRQLSCSTVFSFPERLKQLQKLEIRECDSLEQIVEVVEGEEASDMETGALVQLESVILVGLPKLERFIHTKSNNLIPSLEQVEGERSILFTFSVFGSLQQLKHLEVIDCRLLEGIVDVARGYQTSHRIITSPKLSVLQLKDLPNFLNFSPTTSYGFKMPRLKYFYLYRCPQVEIISLVQIIADEANFSSDVQPRTDAEFLITAQTRRIKILESVGESSHSNQDAEIETETFEETIDEYMKRHREEKKGMDEETLKI